MTRMSTSRQEKDTPLQIECWLRRFYWQVPGWTIRRFLYCHNWDILWFSL